MIKNNQIKNVAPWVSTLGESRGGVLQPVTQE